MLYSGLTQRLMRSEQVFIAVHMSIELLMEFFVKAHTQRTLFYHE